MGVDRTSTTSYRPQGNSMIERTNRTIEKTLSKFVGENHTDWAKYLQTVMMAYRSSIHAVTKYNLYYLIFGRPCSLPKDCMYETSSQTKVFTMPDDRKPPTTENNTDLKIT